MSGERGGLGLVLRVPRPGWLWRGAAAALLALGAVLGAWRWAGWRAAGRRRRLQRIGTVLRLFVYPVKSCRGVPVGLAQVTAMGLRSGELRDRYGEAGRCCRAEAGARPCGRASAPVPAPARLRAFVGCCGGLAVPGRAAGGTPANGVGLQPWLETRFCSPPPRLLSRYRFWLVTKEDGHMVTARQEPRLVLISVSCEDGQLALEAPEMKRLCVPVKLPRKNPVRNCRY